MSNSRPKRVLLNFKDDMLVMPISPAQVKVSDLLSEATLRFRTHRSLPKTDVFIQASVSGYILNVNDNVDEVIEQSDCLTLVNRDTWIANFQQTASPKYWFGIRQYDYKADVRRHISVAYSASKDVLCLTLRKDDDVVAVEFFERDVLSSYAKDGDLLVMNNTDTQDGETLEQSAILVVKDGKASAVRLVLKTFSDDQAEISEWPITLRESDMTHGDIKKIQDTWFGAPAKEYKLPPTIRTGKLLDVETVPPTRDFSTDVNQSTGASPLVFTQTSKVCAERNSSWSTQNVRVELRVTNNSDLTTNISRMLAEYQDATGAWVKVTNLTRGYRENDHIWETREDVTDAYPVGARCVSKFALSLNLPLPEKNFLSNRERCLDVSFPIPFIIRFTFTDQDGLDATITTTLSHRGLHLPTFDSTKENYKHLQKYFFTDDSSTGERLTASYVRGEGDNYIRIAPDSYVHQLTPDSLKTIVYNARQANQPEYELANYSSEPYKGTIHVLVDLENRYAYGCRVRLTTSDSSLDESFLLPKDLQ